jgi:SAM-dependent methyltransferase
LAVAGANWQSAYAAGHRVWSMCYGWGIVELLVDEIGGQLRPWRLASLLALVSAMIGICPAARSASSTALKLRLVSSVRCADGLGNNNGAGGMMAAVKRWLKSVLPSAALRTYAEIRGHSFTPPKGRVKMGDLRRVLPISRQYGFDRGRPIDRYYIEKYLRSAAAIIRGRVLEIGESVYTKEFGGDRVSQSDVLHYHEGNPAATFVGDLMDAPDLPSNAFDCVIVTQTLQLIYDVHAALTTIYRILKPGGVVLATFPGLSQISDDEWNYTWHWGFTKLSARRLFGSVFPPARVEVNTYGNVLSSIAFLHGLADDELTETELDVTDVEYQLLVTATAFKPEENYYEDMANRWDYDSAAAPSAYGDDASYRKAIEFLDGHGVIEDWGCGTGYAKRFVTKSEYVGIDGSPSPLADKIVDLRTYKSNTDCILMRHVLEHNYGWKQILKNAIQSFRRRMVLVVFTPFSAEEVKIADHHGIPDLKLRKADLMDLLQGLSVSEEAITSDTSYGAECIFYLQK